MVELVLRQSFYEALRLERDAFAELIRNRSEDQLVAWTDAHAMTQQAAHHLWLYLNARASAQADSDEDDDTDQSPLGSSNSP